jgi:endonuclease/exonuclease/phosphatase family metal-dependent hydrolase
VIVAGDFNHHRKWDHKRNAEQDPRNHQYVERILRERYGLASVYHQHHIGPSGERLPEQPTFWQAYARDKPHHIDYVYAPESCITDSPDGAWVGLWDDFAAPGHRLSDHAPLVCDFRTPTSS